MKSDSYLKPCPFCGSDPELITRGGYKGESYDVQCTTEGCYLYCGADWHLTKDEVIRLWNNRARVNES